MEVGQIGATGQLVRKPVKLGSNHERGSAPNRCRKTAGNHVRGQREKKRSAVTSSHATVRKITCSTTIMLMYEINITIDNEKKSTVTGGFTLKIFVYRRPKLHNKHNFLRFITNAVI